MSIGPSAIPEDTMIRGGEGRTRLAHAAIAMLVLAYVTYRAAVVAFTYDEAWTVLDFVPNTFTDILRCVPCDANSHLLNSIAIKILYKIGPRTEFMARLPNVIACAVFLLAAHGLAMSYRPHMRHVVFILLVANPFLLDLFGLARGYGMATALECASLCVAISFFRSKRASHAIMSVSFAALAALANMTFLLPAAGTWSIIALALLMNGNGRGALRTLAATTGIMLFLALVLYTPVSELLAIDAFYYGGNKGLFSDSFRSLAAYSAYLELPEPLPEWIMLSLFLIIAIGVVISLVKKRLEITLILPLALLLFCSITLIVVHHMLNVLFPLDRGALFFYPLLILAVCGAISVSPAGLRHSLSILLVMSFGSNLLLNLNGYRTILWEHEAHTPVVLDRLEQMGQELDRPLRLAYSWPYRSVLRYYLERHPYEHIELRDAKGIYRISEADAVLHLGRSLTTAPYDVAEITIESGWDTLIAFPGEQVYVLVDPRLTLRDR